MYQPMWPLTPFGPAATTVFAFVMYCLYWSTCCQSSSTTSTRPSAIAWKTGISVIFVISTLQPSFFSSTYFATYVLAVEPDHACSFRRTFPHDAAVLPAVAVPTASATGTAAAIASATTRRRRLLRSPSFIQPSLCLPWFARSPLRSSPRGHPSAAPALRDPVERDPEREDRERRDDALPERVPLQALGDLVAEGARADEPADDDDGEHHDDPLVDAEHDRVAGERHLHLAQHLRPRRAVRARRLDRVRRDVPESRRDEPDHDRRCIEHRRDQARHVRHGHQVDEGDDVDELRQRLQHVEDRAQDAREEGALRCRDAERDPERDGDQRRDEDLRGGVHRGLPLADDADRDEHRERDERRAQAAQHPRHEHDARNRQEPRRLDEEGLQRLEQVHDEEVPGRLRHPEHG